MELLLATFQEQKKKNGAASGRKSDMTLQQAKQLYIGAGGRTDHWESEWKDIHQEMNALVSAKSDRAAGKLIEWWDSWDRECTATAFARKVRNGYAKMKNEKD
jgi:hypothetical protein